MAFGAPKGKDMQLDRKSKASDIYRVRGELGADADERAPLVGASAAASTKSTLRLTHAPCRPRPIRPPVASPRDSSKHRSVP